MAPKGKKWPARSWPGRIRTLQARLGLSNPEMADLIGIPYRTFTSWKWGERNPPVLGRRRLAELEATK